MKKLPTHTQQKGFTLIETLVAVAIFLLVVVAVFTIAQVSLQQARYSRDKVIATYLAQDALEFTISRIKSSNQLANDGVIDYDSWLVELADNDGTIDCNYHRSATEVTCQVDTTFYDDYYTDRGSIFIPGTPGKLKWDSSELTYNPSGGSGEETQFTRIISVHHNPDDTGDGDDKIEITATVTWTPPGIIAQSLASGEVTQTTQIYYEE